LEFIADFHVHSRFSRATGRDLNLPNLDFWAARKGLTVIGTGDATHPLWLKEIEEELVEAEPGLYKLKPAAALKEAGRARFVLSAEIANIYKKNGRVRKVHNLVLLPDLDSARRLAGRLDRIGNIRSDGRPILGLEAKNLLEICLEISEDIFFIPAHIWTPWFSLFGSKSGFDSIEECFEDLTGHIRALETGLSSDPPMNWRLSALDRFVLVSNSDAHSPAKLGREANLFQTELSYPAMIKAMSRGGGFGGTIEFFPEEGKYHLDGHRKCGRRLSPEETRSLGGLCPVCGRPVTVGVMARVIELADRSNGFRPPEAAPFISLIPLDELLGEVFQCGPQTKKVQKAAEELYRKLGPELFVLRQAPLEDIARIGGGLLAEGLGRMRQGRVYIEAGYDGEFGRVSLFEPGERARLAGQKELFQISSRPKKKAPQPQSAQPVPAPAAPVSDQPAVVLPFLIPDDPLLDDLNPAQKEAVTHGCGPLGVVAGPGTGKTLVLTRRAAWLVREGLAEPEEILAVTFTRQAAGEMAARLAECLPFRPQIKSVRAMTFHALGLKLIKEAVGREVKVLSEEERLDLVKQAAQGGRMRPIELAALISRAKQNLQAPDDLTEAGPAAAFARYEAAKNSLGAVDFDDLVGLAVKVLETEPGPAERMKRNCRWLLIDEYQDINFAQYRLTRLLAPGPRPNLTVIGDPDQAIYGFRGADLAYFQRFQEDFPEARLVVLAHNYRSTKAILAASGQVISRNRAWSRSHLETSLEGPAKVTTAVLPTPKAEAEFVVSKIEKLLGGTSHFALDSGRADSGGASTLSLGDIAVLYRLHAQAEPLAEALSKAGWPVQQAGTEDLRETDHLDFSAEKISLLTMHAAKGLEFEVVFITGLEAGLLPYQPPKKPPAEVEEERRLFYVAMTRAKKHLYLTRSRTRTLFGRRFKPGPSPFLGEIAQNMKSLDRLPDRPKRPKVIQLDLF